jgi:hypothetical protein
MFAEQIRSDSFNTAPLLYTSVRYFTPENIEGRLIMSQQSLTQFFKSTSNKRKLQGCLRDIYSMSNIYLYLP